MNPPQLKIKSIEVLNGSYYRKYELGGTIGTEKIYKIQDHSDEVSLYFSILNADKYKIAAIIDASVIIEYFPNTYE